MSEQTNSPHWKGNVQPTHYNTHAHTKVCTLCLTSFPFASLLHSKTLCPETKTQVKVNKRCLWIFWVTNSNRCLHSPCNYLLTDLILAVKCLAKSMSTHTGPESKVVHTIYLPGPSHTWYTLITRLDRKATQSDLTGDEPQEKIMCDCLQACMLKQTRLIHAVG